MKDCENCKGKGIREAYTLSTGYVIQARDCVSCSGKGKFPEINETAILDAILVRPKNGKARVRSAKPKDGRAAYVWRMARFHGGIDVHLPVMATFDISGDPYEKELSLIADRVAKEYFGSDLRGAARWGKALGYLG